MDNTQTIEQQIKELWRTLQYTIPKPQPEAWEIEEAEALKNMVSIENIKKVFDEADKSLSLWENRNRKRGTIKTLSTVREITDYAYSNEQLLKEVRKARTSANRLIRYSTNQTETDILKEYSKKFTKQIADFINIDRLIIRQRTKYTEQMLRETLNRRWEETAEDEQLEKDNK